MPLCHCPSVCRQRILLSRLDALAVGLALTEHLQAWATNTYLTRRATGVFNPDPEAPTLCPTCHMSPCECNVPEGDAQTGALSEHAFRYADGTMASENEAERKAFLAYVTATSKVPPNVATLRQWVLDTPER